MTVSWQNLAAQFHRQTVIFFRKPLAVIPFCLSNHPQINVTVVYILPILTDRNRSYILIYILIFSWQCIPSFYMTNHDVYEVTTTSSMNNLINVSFPWVLSQSAQFAFNWFETPFSTISYDMTRWSLSWLYLVMFYSIQNSSFVKRVQRYLIFSFIMDSVTMSENLNAISSF